MPTLFKVVPHIDPPSLGRWGWSMHIEGSPADLARVRSVTYGLHPVFPNPNRVIRNAANGFELKMRPDLAADETWGRFDVRVTIALAAAKREIQIVPLELMNPDGSLANELLSLPPTADFELSKTYYG